MSTPEETIKLEMRLSAIEYLLCKMYITLIAATGQSDEQIEQAFDEFVAGTRQQLFPGFDPAQSDLISAEWEEAVTRLIACQREMLAQVLGERAP